MKYNDVFLYHFLKEERKCLLDIDKITVIDLFLDIRNFGNGA